MITDPETIAAANLFAGTPGTPETSLIRAAEVDAFIAGVAWRDGHPKGTA